MPHTCDLLLVNCDLWSVASRNKDPGVKCKEKILLQNPPVLKSRKTEKNCLERQAQEIIQISFWKVEKNPPLESFSGGIKVISRAL